MAGPSITLTNIVVVHPKDKIIEQILLKETVEAIDRVVKHQVKSMELEPHNPCLPSRAEILDHQGRSSRSLKHYRTSVND